MHSGGIDLHRLVKEHTYVGKGFHSSYPIGNLFSRYSENRAGQDDILTSGEIGIKPGSELKQGGYPSCDRYFSTKSASLLRQSTATRSIFPPRFCQGCQRSGRERPQNSL